MHKYSQLSKSKKVKNKYSGIATVTLKEFNGEIKTYKVVPNDNAPKSKIIFKRSRTPKISVCKFYTNKKNDALWKILSPKLSHLSNLENQKITIINGKKIVKGRIVKVAFADGGETNPPITEGLPPNDEN